METIDRNKKTFHYGPLSNFKMMTLDVASLLKTKSKSGNRATRLNNSTNV